MNSTTDTSSKHKIHVHSCVLFFHNKTNIRIKWSNFSFQITITKTPPEAARNLLSLRTYWYIQTGNWFYCWIALGLIEPQTRNCPCGCELREFPCCAEGLTYANKEVRRPNDSISNLRGSGGRGAGGPHITTASIIGCKNYESFPPKVITIWINVLVLRTCVTLMLIVI